MKPGKNTITLNNSLNDTLFSEYDILSKKLYSSLDDSLQINLKDFLLNGLVSNNIAHLFKDRDYFNSNREENNFELKFGLMTLRYSFVERFGFVLLNEDLLDKTAQFLDKKSVCEIGAGTGWLSHNLQKRDIDIIAVDYKPGNDSDFGFKKLHTDVLLVNGIEYLENNSPEVVILSWPDYDTSFASDVFNTLKSGQTLIYVGENEGGCTGDDHFFQLLDNKATLNETITDSLQKSALCWTGVHDTWYVYTIK